MFYTFRKYFHYFVVAQRKKQILSPFALDFSKNILQTQIPFSFQRKINDLSVYYKKNNQNLPIEDYGAGSKTKRKSAYLATAKIVNKVTTTTKYGQVLYQMVNHYQIQKSLELGTSLGIGSAYLSSKPVLTIEGNKSLAKFTKDTLNKFDFSEINVRNAKFDDIFENLLQNESFDLFFIDGNHTYDATVNYFELILKYKKKKAIIIFDDIYWSKAMGAAWDFIKKHEKANYSIDLFKFGIVFLDENSSQKENYMLWY